MKELLSLKSSETGNEADIPLREQLAFTMHWIHSQGWAPGTGGNFSVVLSNDPIRLLMSPSGVDKGSVAPTDLIEVGLDGSVLQGAGKASAETLLHTTIVHELGAGAVLHTHSHWNTALSLSHLSEGALEISGYEMLKGLAGVTTHDHTEKIPIFPNSQDISSLSKEVGKVLREKKGLHGFLLSGHGLYTWGRDLVEAKRHLEIFEFLFETVGLKRLYENTTR